MSIRRLLLVSEFAIGCCVATENFVLGMLFGVLKKFKVHAVECISKKQLHPHRQLFKFIYDYHFENVIRPELARKFGVRERKITQIGDTYGVVYNAEQEDPSIPNYKIVTMRSSDLQSLLDYESCGKRNFSQIMETLEIVRNPEQSDSSLPGPS